jgi:predicted dehydrogenase
MGLAKSEAQRLSHDYIGTEHLLLGIVQEGSCVAANVLKTMNVDLAGVRAEIEEIVKVHPKAILQNLPFTPRAKRVLELAVEEAHGLGHTYLGTEHLLLGLIKEAHGIAARVLMERGLELDPVRAKVVELLGAEMPAAEPSPRSIEDRLPPAVESTRSVRRATSRGIALPPFAPPRSSLRIGVIGAGGIVQNAHLPGYAKFGYRVSAIVDVNREAAESAAKKFGIPVVCATVDELLARNDVDVADVAIPEHGRPLVLPKVLAAGKPTLLQKPLAYTLEEAKRIVAEFERAKVPLAVNQNMRWSPEFRAARHLIESGALGRVFDLRWTMRNTSDRRDWAKGSWYSRDPRFQVLSWSIHELDAFRFLLDDEPERVYCALPRRPDQNFVGDAAATAVIHFKDGCHVSMVDSNVSTPGRPEVQLLDVDGSEGSLTFSIAEPRYFVYWLAKEIEAKPNGDAPAHVVRFENVWYPDGFAGAMGDFLEAVEKGREPSVSGRRNLGTMALVDACYRSAAAKQAVTLEPG